VNRLVTERDVAALDGKGPIVVDDGTLITPAALDLAHERGIAVLYARGRGERLPPERVPGAGGADPGKALPAEVLSRDGVYLVRVEAGVARIYRVGASGLEPIS
jgi:hypothetical protein